MKGRPIVGADILRLITAGMYNNPLVVYREYLQNSADAIAAQGGAYCSVSVDLDPVNSEITIIDNGIGLSPDEAGPCLIDIGRSRKDREVDRGFRGIGRLCALAFADRIIFTTRSCAEESVTQVTWDGRLLRDVDHTGIDAEAAIKKCTSIRLLPGGSWPDRFFQVEVQGVSRHAAATLLNPELVRRYIGEVCPVPMASSFPLAVEIERFLATHSGYFVLDVRMKGSDTPIERPFGQSIPLTDHYQAPYRRLETIVIPSPHGGDAAALLWLAHTPYSGSIPKGLSIRGIRARVGNIQVGTDRSFDHLFLEPRFNGWCVGEVHIVDKGIVPNGRRDYFEPSPHLRHLENHIGAIAHRISSECRRASSHRNKIRSIGAAIGRLKDSHDLARSRYLHPKDLVALIDRERRQVSGIRKTLADLGVAESNEQHDELDVRERQLGSIAIEADSGALPNIPASSVSTLQSVFAAIAKSVAPDVALDMIETILADFGPDQSEQKDWH